MAGAGLEWRLLLAVARTLRAGRRCSWRRVRGRQVDDRPTGGRSAQLQRGQEQLLKTSGLRKGWTLRVLLESSARRCAIRMAPPQPGGGTGGEGRGAAHQGSPRGWSSMS